MAKESEPYWLPNLWVGIIEQEAIINLPIDSNADNTCLARPAPSVQRNFNTWSDVCHIYFNDLLKKTKTNKKNPRVYWCLLGLIFFCFFFWCVCRRTVLFGMHQLNGEGKVTWGNLARFWLQANFKHFMTANLLQRIKETVGRASRSRKKQNKLTSLKFRQESPYQQGKRKARKVCLSFEAFLEHTFNDGWPWPLPSW